MSVHMSLDSYFEAEKIRKTQPSEKKRRCVRKAHHHAARMSHLLSLSKEKSALAGAAVTFGAKNNPPYPFSFGPG